MKRLLSLFAAACITTGCASFSTRIEAPEATEANREGGLVYRLPLKTVTLVYTVTDKGATWSHTTTSIPDLRTRFVLQFEPSAIGKSDMKIGVNELGLLSSSGSTQTGGLDELLVAAAGAAGPARAITFGGLDRAPADGEKEPPTPACSNPGTYVFNIPMSHWDSSGASATTYPFCNADITVSELRAGTPSETPSNEPSIHVATDAKRDHAGVFYRQNRPFSITVSQGNAVVASFVALLPNGSPTEFLPLHRALFADSVSSFGFTDGIPTKFEQAADSEAIAVLSTPARVLEGYFGAIGAAFGKRGSAATKETENIAAMNALLAAQFRQERCRQALAAANQTDVTTFCK